eukprot:2313101-Amphidinium_carterae.1
MKRHADIASDPKQKRCCSENTLSLIVLCFFGHTDCNFEGRGGVADPRINLRQWRECFDGVQTRTSWSSLCKRFSCKGLDKEISPEKSFPNCSGTSHPPLKGIVGVNGFGDSRFKSLVSEAQVES